MMNAASSPGRWTHAVALTAVAMAAMWAMPIVDAVADRNKADVRVGIDVLVEHDYEHLAGRRVALITNHTGLDRKGRRTVDLLHEADDVELVTLLAPEHGLWGVLDEAVGHAQDEETGLRVWSLYGETRKPTAEMLEGVDTLVFDIQDIGARFYTYISTMGHAMEAAAEHGLRFVVLDRPNPITGNHVAGPLADEDDLAFVAYRPIPIVHGMTVGELAMLFRMHYGVECDLVVIPMRHWRRDMWWDQTGREWINPSPNMPSPTAALVYPGIALVEFTNVSVGRGTDSPFGHVGAPWIDADALAEAMNGHELPGLRFTPTTFTPTASKFADEPCHGIRIEVTDRDAVEPVTLGLTLAWQLKQQHGDAFEPDRVNVLLRNREAHEAWQEADDPTSLGDVWAEDLDNFREIRRDHLIYE